VPDGTHGDDEVDRRSCLGAKDAVDVSKIAVLSDDAVPFPRNNEWHGNAHPGHSRRRSWPPLEYVPTSCVGVVRISALPGRLGSSRPHTRNMVPRAVSMRWWLALTFAGIAALTAIAVAQVFSTRSESAIRERASELTAGSVLTAGLEISDATTLAEVRSRAGELGDARRMAFFVLDEDGILITPAQARGISLETLPNFDRLRAASLDGRRVVETSDGGRMVAVALPLRRGPGAALIGVAASTDLEQAVGIVRDEIVRAALWAVAIGAAVGLGVAMLITRRLRRIATAAAEIEQGRFDRELTSSFGDELGVLAGTIDDMRKRLRASFDGLESERDRLLRLLEQLQEGVIAVDRDLTVEFANSRARSLLQRTLDAGTPLPEPWPEMPLRNAVESLFASGSDVQTIRAHLDSGTTYVIVLLPPTAALQAGVVVITDVTEQERREWAEREFVMNAAHELRTPLAAIASAVEVLQSGAKTRPEDRDRFLTIVERQTTRLTKLARSLLTLARAQTGSESVRLEPVRVAELLDEIAAEAEDAEVTISMCCEAVTVRAHRELLYQALENVAANARKHAARRLVLGADHIGGDRVRIDIADDGRGMSRHDAERAVDRFYRAPGSAGDGFGLGLPIVREVVRAMDGTLSIDSTPGEGTTVSIELESVDDVRSCA
jgi:two-component system, OmpR family, sensor histidine kinase VicK